VRITVKVSSKEQLLRQILDIVPPLSEKLSDSGTSSLIIAEFVKQMASLT
jgi:hypothetical protein